MNRGTIQAVVVNAATTAITREFSDRGVVISPEVEVMLRLNTILVIERLLQQVQIAA